MLVFLLGQEAEVERQKEELNVALISFDEAWRLVVVNKV
jgi:hypothetical protein